MTTFFLDELSHQRDDRHGRGLWHTVHACVRGTMHDIRSTGSAQPTLSCSLCLWPLSVLWNRPLEMVRRKRAGPST